MADIQEHVNDDSIHANRLRQLISYVRRQWTNKHSVGPERLSVHDNHSPTNKVLESYNAALRRRTKVSHPNLYSFLGRLQDYVRITATVSFSVRVIVSGGAAGEFNRRRYFYQSVISMKPIWAGGCINKKHLAVPATSHPETGARFPGTSQKGGCDDVKYLRRAVGRMTQQLQQQQHASAV